LFTQAIPLLACDWLSNMGAPHNKHNEPHWATLKAGMTEQRNGGMAESRNHGTAENDPNPKRRNRRMVERRKITPNPKRRNHGTVE